MARPLAQTCAALSVLWAVAIALPPTGRATPAWFGLGDIAEESHSPTDSVDAAMDAKGDTMLVWVQDSGAGRVVDAAWRPAGGAFGTPVSLSSESEASAPVVAMDPRGDATVAWVEGAQDASVVQAAWRPAGGVFTPATTLSEQGYGASSPVVAMDSKGDATVAWVWNNAGFDEVFAASRPVGGAFEAHRSLSLFSFGNADMPAVAMDSEGDTTVAWKDYAGEPVAEYPSLMQMATQPLGAGFAPPTGFSLEASYPAVAMDSHGDTTVVWTRKENATNIIEASTRIGLNSSFETPVVLASSPSEENEIAIHPKVAMDAAGDTTVAWALHGGMRMETRPAGGSFGKVIELLKSSIYSESLPEIALDSRGDGMVVWWETTPFQGSNSLGSAMLAGGTFGVPAYLPMASANPPSSPASLAMDSQGDAVSASVSSDDEKDDVQVAGYQAGGPWLEALQTPTKGVAGATLAFSVSPLSVWSTVASTTWSWGDGSPEASGTSVTHVFSAPGTYHVEVSATDALGNVTSATRTITIQAPPVIQPETQIQPETHSQPEAHGQSETHIQSTKQTPRITVPVPKTAVSSFTPLFATRASTGGDTLGLLVGIPTVKGARKGDTIVVRCLAGCKRPLHEIVHVREHRNTAITVSPPLAVLQNTRIEIELLAPEHLARFVLYDFVRTSRGLIAQTAHKGCLSTAGRTQRCP
jgi:hypothetical protein